MGVSGPKAVPSECSDGTAPESRRIVYESSGIKGNLNELI